MTITTVYTKNLTDPIPDNSSGAFDYGWVGQHQRPLEHATGLQPVIEMGARPYNPILGRFLRLDPIPGGATDSDYAYVNDPINTYDLSGELLGIKCGWCKKAAKGAAKLANNPIVQAAVVVAACFTPACTAVAVGVAAYNTNRNYDAYRAGTMTGKQFWMSTVVEALAAAVPIRSARSTAVAARATVGRGAQQAAVRAFSRQVAVNSVAVGSASYLSWEAYRGIAGKS